MKQASFAFVFDWYFHYYAFGRFVHFFRGAAVPSWKLVIIYRSALAQFYFFFWHFSGQDIDDLLPGAEKVEEIDPNFPDLSQHNNWMSKSLTPAIYRQLKDRKTSSGYTLDMCIQTGKRMVISLHVAWRRNACRIRYVSCAACFHSNTSCLSSLRISSFRDYIIFLTLSVLPESPQVVGNVSSSPSTWPF